MKKKSESKKLAKAHMDWMIKKILIPITRTIGEEEFEHGYKHGWDDAKRKKK